MNLFRFSEDYSEDEDNRERSRVRKRMNRGENDPVFKGKVNISLEELQNADELWLVKVPKEFKPERLEGHEITLENEAENILELNNGAKQEARVTKIKHKIPLVIPDQSKQQAKERAKFGLTAEKAFQELEEGRLTEKFAEYVEEANAVSLQFRGKIVLSKHVPVKEVPKPKPEETIPIPRPKLKRRHPFFGLDSPPAKIEEGKKVSRKRKKRSI